MAKRDDPPEITGAIGRREGFGIGEWGMESQLGIVNPNLGLSLDFGLDAPGCDAQFGFSGLMPMGWMPILDFGFDAHGLDAQLPERRRGEGGHCCAPNGLPEV